jgi:hypothetical protein
MLHCGEITVVCHYPDTTRCGSRPRIKSVKLSGCNVRPSAELKKGMWCDERNQSFM